MSEKSRSIFGNPMAEKIYRKAVKTKRKNIKKFGDDSNADYPISVEKNAFIGDSLGVMIKTFRKKQTV